jgi:hypothetical protein
MRLTPLSYLSKTGMITAWLTTSQVSISPANPITSRRMGPSCAATISSSGRSSSQSAVIVCQHSG